jgi:hypothetical protein
MIFVIYTKQKLLVATKNNNSVFKLQIFQSPALI